MKKIILSLLIALTATIGANAQTQTYDFIMPAYDVELTTELWYKLSETATDNQVNYGTKTDVYLERTLLAGGWNTFCAPISISKQKMETVFGEGVQVKELRSSNYDNETKVLTLTFGDPDHIVSGSPYLIKLGGEANVDLTADGKEFANVEQDWRSKPNQTTYVTFQPVLVPEELQGGDKSVLFVANGNTLTYPITTGNINAFRAYFKLLGDAATGAPAAFRMDFGQEIVTGILEVEASAEKRQTGIYTIDGRKLDRLPNIPGVYIVNGEKRVVTF